MTAITDTGPFKSIEDVQAFRRDLFAALNMAAARSLDDAREGPDPTTPVGALGVFARGLRVARTQGGIALEDDTDD